MIWLRIILLITLRLWDSYWNEFLATEILVQFGVQLFLPLASSVRFELVRMLQTFAEFLALKYLQNFLFGSQLPEPVYWSEHFYWEHHLSNAKIGYRCTWVTHLIAKHQYSEWLKYFAKLFIDGHGSVQGGKKIMVRLSPNFVMYYKSPLLIWQIALIWIFIVILCV